MRSRQLEHLVAGQAAQQQRPARPREVGQRGRDLAVASGLARAVGAHGEDAGAVQAAREELQQPHGGDVGRVQVVQHDHGGTPGRGGPDERCRGVEGGEARGLGVERRRGVGRRGQPLAELRRRSAPRRALRCRGPPPPRRPAAPAPAPGSPGSRASTAARRRSPRRCPRARCRPARPPPPRSPRPGGSSRCRPLPRSGTARRDRHAPPRARRTARPILHAYRRAAPVHQLRDRRHCDPPSGPSFDATLARLG